MADWQDQGIIVNPRHFGENDALVHIFTQQHGLCAGIVKYGQTKRLKPILQLGQQVSVKWRARLETQLGNFNLEPLKSPSPQIMLEKGRLYCLSAALSLIQNVMAEHEPHPAAYDDLNALILTLESDVWAETYAKWEIALLNDIGFGLDFSSCAATGERDDLCYVSPKSGRAVSKNAGLPYHDRLLPLPEFLMKAGAKAGADQLTQALRMSGHFLSKGPLAHSNHGLPLARTRLLSYVSKI
ncbi:MAG: DNA repair protein RecO [Alphaproteobacteria bacterium]